MTKFCQAAIPYFPPAITISNLSVIFIFTCSKSDLHKRVACLMVNRVCIVSSIFDGSNSICRKKHLMKWLLVRCHWRWNSLRVWNDRQWWFCWYFRVGWYSFINTTFFNIPRFNCWQIHMRCYHHLVLCILFPLDCNQWLTFIIFARKWLSNGGFKKISDSRNIFSWNKRHVFFCGVCSIGGVAVCHWSLKLRCCLR